MSYFALSFLADYTGVGHSPLYYVLLVILITTLLVSNTVTVGKVWSLVSLPYVAEVDI